MRGEEGDYLASPLMGLSAPPVLYPELPCFLRHPQQGIHDSSIPAGGDRPGFPCHTINSGHAGDEWDCTAHRLCVSAVLEQVWVSLKGSACALKPDPEFPVCFMTLANRRSNPALGSRFSGKDEQDLPCSRYPHNFFKNKNLLWTLPAIWLQA